MERCLLFFFFFSCCDLYMVTHNLFVSAVLMMPTAAFFSSTFFLPPHFLSPFTFTLNLSCNFYMHLYKYSLLQSRRNPDCPEHLLLRAVYITHKEGGMSGRCFCVFFSWSGLKLGELGKSCRFLLQELMGNGAEREKRSMSTSWKNVLYV